jgi:hypothetical protein
MRRRASRHCRSTRHSPRAVRQLRGAVESKVAISTSGPFAQVCARDKSNARGAPWRPPGGFVAAQRTRRKIAPASSGKQRLAGALPVALSRCPRQGRPYRPAPASTTKLPRAGQYRGGAARIRHQACSGAQGRHRVPEFARSALDAASRADAGASCWLSARRAGRPVARRYPCWGANLCRSWVCRLFTVANWLLAGGLEGVW